MENVYFSPGPDCLTAIIDRIKKAKQSILLCVYTISDDRISENLVMQHRKGVDVKIITDNNKRFDEGSDIDFLVKSGIPVKIDTSEAHMHNKFAVFDDKISITGSYNWTRSAEKYNNENILETDSKKIASAFITEFNKLWNLSQRI